MDTLTPQEGKQLLKLARDTIRGRLGLEPIFDKVVEESGLADQYATFVTLKKNGRLRGCIGNLEPVSSVYKSIRYNADKAAFNDNRFPSLTQEEEGEIRLELSILTQPEPMEYSDGDDLLKKLRPGQDGVTIRLGRATATFLPQVWSQLPQPEEFLGQLCRKAGLFQNDWRESHPIVETYQVQSFTEEELG